MRNFAEEMAYWYFRLNGFFVLENFVLHRQDLDSNQHADMDLLAIRHKYTYEEIGGKKDDRDPKLFKHFDEDKHIGIICEVKSGRNLSRDDIKFDRPDRINYAIRRLGIFAPLNAKQKARELAKEPVIEGNFHQVGKVLITNNDITFPDYICITLEHIQTFLYEHMKKYIDPKSGGKNFFPSELLQYIIWNVERNLHTING
jgi:hypothetical protein